MTDFRGNRLAVEKKLWRRSPSSCLLLLFLLRFHWRRSQRRSFRQQIFNPRRIRKPPSRLSLACYRSLMSEVVIYTDGGARGNPGPAGAGVVIIDGETRAEVKAYLGEKQTNNWAEYEAVVIALGKALEMMLRDRDLEFRLDSQLVVEQLKG